jgi:undecaprenyl pyrophosphate phosphatase UppP
MQIAYVCIHVNIYLYILWNHKKKRKNKNIKNLYSMHVNNRIIIALIQTLNIPFIFIFT